MFIRCERKHIDERLLDYFYTNGGLMYEIDSPKDLQPGVDEAIKLTKAGKIDVLLIDGLSNNVMDYITEQLNKSSDGRAVYGGNMNTILRFLFGTDNLTIPLVITCLRKSDKLYEGGPAAAPTKEIFMPDLPGQLETRAAGVGADLLGELVADGNKRTLYIESNAARITRIPTGSGMRNIVNPTAHNTHNMLPGAPANARMTYENTIKFLGGDYTCL